MTTTTTTTTGQAGNTPPKNGANGANADAKAKAKSEAKKEKSKIRNKLRKQKIKEKKNENNNNNNNHVKFDGLILEGVIKGITISPGTSATMTSDFRNMENQQQCTQPQKGTNIGQVPSISWNQLKTKCGRPNVPIKTYMQ